MVTLLHTNASLEFFLFVALRVVGAMIMNVGALCFGGGLCPVGGQGVMKRLIVDRGFLDGEAISQCKETLRHRDPYPDSAKTWISMPMPWRCFNPRTFNGWSAKARRKEGRSRSSTTTPPGYCETGESAAEDTASVQRTTGTASPRKGADQKGGGRYRRVFAVGLLAPSP